MATYKASATGKGRAGAAFSPDANRELQRPRRRRMRWSAPVAAASSTQPQPQPPAASTSTSPPPPSSSENGSKKAKSKKASNAQPLNAQQRAAYIPKKNIRNFSIIAHVDHGKSTLADGLLEFTETVHTREMASQFLDGMDLERERGITIKLQAARMRYTPEGGEPHALNLIDTPGHVDFSYEVSRSLAACEAALLIVDASQGVEAQTLANCYLALENDLEIIPVLNKIDLPGADPDRVLAEIEDLVGIDATEAIMCSAKQRIGIKEVLDAIVARCPPPPAEVEPANPLRALIFDSYYDAYRGVVVMFRIVDGSIKKGDKIRFMNSGVEYDIDEVGVISPKQVPVNDRALEPGEVGYLCASIKEVAHARVGDTITSVANEASDALPGYQEATPMVYAGLFPTDQGQYNDLREALEKLQLNDAALSFEVENSPAMGFGFRCGFLGLLHSEIVQERLEREYNLDLITTAPTVVYEVLNAKGETVVVDNPADMPPPDRRREVREPYVRVDLFTPEDYVGTLMELNQDRRGEFITMEYLGTGAGGGRTKLSYEVPLAEVVCDYFDAVKSRSKGYASMEYTMTGYRKNNLVRLDVKINGEEADPLSCIVHKDKAYGVGRDLVDRLKELIPRQQFPVPIQATIGAKSVASARIPAIRKDVLAKCYGGDISRKKKLLKKQAEGKKRMKAIGRVDVPQEAFMAILNKKEN
ncbi:hypothetical protein PPROV_001127200 [Pycnococcus provasolii]|uniref:Translation factor GUF1 homolog, mitochondrial n=1 Tax=Pycnococcus provasolii TaxID=41880 RepID=A0A830HZI9_9CHLO|nr:hypothetical protein PPROV_001127200 [Pycnococcus provasolii]